MAEQLDLLTPAKARPGTSFWRPVRLVLDEEAELIEAGFRGANGERTTGSYHGDEALILMRQLDIANLSVKSMRRRVIEKMQADGILPAGTISGTPD